MPIVGCLDLIFVLRLRLPESVIYEFGSRAQLRCFSNHLCVYFNVVDRDKDHPICIARLHDSECDMVKYFMSRLIYFQEPEASENKACALFHTRYLHYCS